MKRDVKFLFSKGAVIMVIVLILAGWWFIRSYIIYDGDILGMRTSSHYAELYAQELYKPSNRFSMQKIGMSISEMFFYVPGYWMHNWITTVAVSFVGTFGFLKIFMPYGLSKIYFLIFGVGIAGLLIQFRYHFFLRGESCEYHKRCLGDGTVLVKVIYKKSHWNKKNVFNWCMLLAVFIPFVLLVYYAYCSEFQAQGRYLMPALIPVMYFITLGYRNLLKRFVKNQKVQRGFYVLTSLVWVAFSVYTYVAVFLPNY